jgi:SAM-dependent methyltransferase
MAAMTGPLDVAGAETLDIMQAAPNYNAWQYARIAPYLGRRVCEVGSGIGNMSSLILSDPRELVVLTDTDHHYLERLRTTFAHRSETRVEYLRLPDQSAAERFEQYSLDTVVALNVLEHIADDVQAMESIARLLRPGGRFVVLVPALQALFGSLDRELGHVRRYSRRTLTQALELAGFRVQHTFYFNTVGVLGWWLNSRVRKSRLIPRSQLRCFDALVPLLRLEDHLPRPFGQSVVGVGLVT